MSNKSKGFEKILEVITNAAKESGWDCILVTDENLEPCGIITGPKDFIKEFTFLEEGENMEVLIPVGNDESGSLH